MAPFTLTTKQQRTLQNLGASGTQAEWHFTRLEGLTGSSWRIEAGQTNALLKTYTPHKQQLGIVFGRELRVLAHIRRLQLGPRLLASDRQAGWTLLEWLSGQPLSAIQWQSEQIQRTLSAQLVKLHGLPPSRCFLDLRQQLAGYWHCIDSRRITPRWKKMQQDFIHRPFPKAVKMATLHMDLHPGNVIQTSTGLRWIDWEYAASGDIALELAALFSGNGWSRGQQETFLRYYQSAGGYADIQRLQQAIEVWQPWVVYLAKMWHEVRWEQTRDEACLVASQALGL